MLVLKWSLYKIRITQSFPIDCLARNAFLSVPKGLLKGTLLPKVGFFLCTTFFWLVLSKEEKSTTRVQKIVD